MRNPFQSEQLPPESEAGAGELFSQLSSEELSTTASASIRGSMLNALSASGAAIGHKRFAFAGSAVMLPLLAVGAVGAATGDSPVSAPVALFESAATSMGILSAEAPQANESTVTLAQETGTGIAPSVNVPTGSAAPSPNLDGLAQAQEGEEGEEGEDGETEGDGPAAAAAAAHENGNGCDDVLFGAGEPPFATPGGPVGCEVGNSGDHRQNGANHEEDDGEETPDEGENPEEDGEEDEDDSQGGVSHGLGRGHDEDRPGNGNGFGHDKHGHEPNTNGHGPGGPNGDDGEEGDTGEDGGGTTTDPEPVAADSQATGPGNSATAPGQQNKGGKKD